MKTELLIMNNILPEEPSHKYEYAKQHFNFKWK